MKLLRFFTEAEFIAQLDGKVYAISNANGAYLCDVLEDDYVKLLDDGLCVNLDDGDDFLVGLVRHGLETKEPYSQYVLTQRLNLFEEVMFKEHFGVQIEILENKR